MNEPSVVVGLDGCDACQAALRYACEEVGRRGCRLTVVAAYGRPGASAADNAEAANSPAAAAHAVARQCLELAGLTASSDGVDWHIVTKEMRPVDALAAVAHGAHAIVLGRHHGEPGGGKQVGSTTSHLLNHSPIPVISVPPGYRQM